MTYADDTAGFEAGSDTSRERAEFERDSGRAQKRANEVLTILRYVKGEGATWRDLSQAMHVHHGSASSALTNLHREGRIARTQRKRLHSKVYVLAEFALPDDILEPYIPRSKPDHDRVTILEDRIERAFMALMNETSGAALKILSEES